MNFPEDSDQIIQSSSETCDQLLLSAHDLRRQAALSRRLVDQARQLREKVPSQELRVMEGELKEPVSDEDVNPDPDRDDGEQLTTAGEEDEP